MPTDETPEPGGSPVPDDALAQAMAELRAERAPASGEPADRYWLRQGVWLGLNQPGRAALLLGGLEVRATGLGSAPHEVSAADADRSQHDAVIAAADGTEVAADVAVVDEAEAAGTHRNEVPVRSLLLARSARLPASAAPETVFGWVAQLTPTEIKRLGHAVTELVAGGARRDLERGFGLAWTAGARLPREDLRRMFGRFGELELAVCGVLGGRDLLSIPRPAESGVGSLISVFVHRSDPAAIEAAAILEREGEPARRALVAIWNTWVAMRYRDLIPPPLFEQLVRAWVVVVGRLPEP